MTMMNVNIVAADVVWFENVIGLRQLEAFYDMP